jgi:hypothetical protein
MAGLDYQVKNCKPPTGDRERLLVMWAAKQNNENDELGKTKQCELKEEMGDRGQKWHSYLIVSDQSFQLVCSEWVASMSLHWIPLMQPCGTYVVSEPFASSCDKSRVLKNNASFYVCHDVNKVVRHQPCYKGKGRPKNRNAKKEWLADPW